MKGVQQRTGWGWERIIVDVSQHSSFVGLALKRSREVGLTEHVRLQGVEEGVARQVGRNNGAHAPMGVIHGREILRREPGAGSP